MHTEVVRPQLVEMFHFFCDADGTSCVPSDSLSFPHFTFR